MKENNKNRPSVLYANMDDFMPIIEERLSEGHSVELSPRGVSMLPLIREGKDSVVLSPVVGRLKKYDIPLYRRKGGVYVLHRVVAVDTDKYVMIGDNQFKYETGIDHSQIIAVVSSIRRGGRLFSVEHPIYRIYVVLWHKSRPIRHLAFRALRKIKRIIKK